MILRMLRQVLGKMLFANKAPRGGYETSRWKFAYGGRVQESSYCFEQVGTTS